MPADHPLQRVDPRLKPPGAARRRGHAPKWRRSIADPFLAAEAVPIAQHRAFARLRPQGRGRNKHRYRPFPKRLSAAWSDFHGASTHGLRHPVDELAPTFGMTGRRQGKRQGSHCEHLENQPCRIHVQPRWMLCAHRFLPRRTGKSNITSGFAAPREACRGLARPAFDANLQIRIFVKLKLRKCAPGGKTVARVFFMSAIRRPLSSRQIRGPQFGSCSSREMALKAPAKRLGSPGPGDPSHSWGISSGPPHRQVSAAESFHGPPACPRRAAARAALCLGFGVTGTAHAPGALAPASRVSRPGRRTSIRLGGRPRSGRRL